MPHDKTMKFLFMFESLEDRARAIALFNVFKNDVEISSSGSRNIEIMALHVTKGNALTRLCDYLSIDVKNTLPVGDELNDISMLSISPNSVTLKSSKQEVQQAAGYVLDQPTSVVVGKAIEMLVLNK
jgi:hydroxymethylpyrimidine pyrophosphatase-like HAD family hydrolase